LQSIQQSFDAVILATGAQKEDRLMLWVTQELL
jgi:hypothetical protein